VAPEGVKSRSASKKIAKKDRKESDYNIKVGPSRTTTGYTEEYAVTDGVMRKMK